jgi:hypothetical protein
MNPIRHLLPTAIAGFLLIQGVSSLSAQTLLLDFGPTAVTGGDRLVSPGHAVNAVPSSALSWNQITADSSGLVSSTGASTGVSVNIGQESSAGSGTINFNFEATGSTGGAGAATGALYAGTKVARDALFSGTAGSALGVRIDGLSAGDYTLYFTARNTATTLTTNRAERLYLNVGDSASTFAFGGLTSDNYRDVANTNTLSNAGGVFELGVSYNSISFTLLADQSVFIATDGIQIDEARGFLNSVEIVAAIPEPSTYALLLGGLCVVACVVRKSSLRIKRR